MQGPWVVVPQTPKAAITLSALVRAASEKGLMAVVRFGLIASSSIALGIMLPIVGASSSEFDHFQLYKLAWGNELRTVVLPEHDDAIAVGHKLSFSLLSCPECHAVWLRISMDTFNSSTTSECFETFRRS
jgi:hypothetical protein